MADLIRPARRGLMLVLSSPSTSGSMPKANTPDSQDGGSAPNVLKKARHQFACRAKLDWVLD